MINEIINAIDKALIEFKYVILLKENDLTLFNSLYKVVNDKGLSCCQIWHCMDYKNDTKYVKHIEKKDMDVMIEIYHMYEFADRIIVISDTRQYGSLFNYVKTGILTKQEMMDALLYKI